VLSNQIWVNNSLPGPRCGPDHLIWSLLWAVSLCFRCILPKEGIQGGRAPSNLCAKWLLSALDVKSASCRSSHQRLSN